MKARVGARTILKCMVRNLQSPSLLRVHSSRLLCGDRKERGVEGGQVLFDKVSARHVHLCGRQYYVLEEYIRIVNDEPFLAS